MSGHPGAADSVNPLAIDILLIDDNEDYLFLIRRALEGHDPRYRVHGVASPKEAYRLLDERTFQLVLLDYKFPKSNGLEVIRQLKEKSTFIPTVMVTAFGDEGLALQAMREGALDFVPKTRDFVQALPPVVSRAIERGRIIRERIRTHEALERRNLELSVVNDIVSGLAARQAVRSKLALALDRLGDLLGASVGEAWLLDPAGDLVRACVDGPTEGRTDLQALAEQAVADCALATSIGEGGSTLLAAPLSSHEDAIGALVFAVPGGRVADGSVRALVETLGKQVGVAVEEARLQEELAATKSYLQDLVESAGDEVVTIDRDGSIRTWNGGAEALYGHSREEVLGHDWRLLWPTDRRDEARALARRVVDHGETIKNHETVRCTASGSLVDILLTLSPLREPAGRIRGVSCIGKDLTFRKQLQAQLVQSEKMAAVGQLISGVAHELNNPLTAVLGYSQLVSSAETGAKLPIYLGRIANEAGRCQRIVQNLLAFARKHEPRAVPSDMNQVVRDTLELRRYDLRVNDVEIVEDLGSDLPCTLADPHQLQQVFINVINNAQHAMRSSGRPGRLLVRTRFERGAQGEATLVVSFHDSGPGIPRDLREKIFDPFFTTKGIGEGTGLGLSLSYGIVQEHGGTIVAGDSEEGGASFTVRLPVLPDPARLGEARRSAEPRSVRVGATPPAPREPLVPRPERAGPPRRILVVDDQDSVREVFLDVLSADGHEVDLAADGRQALQLIQDGGLYDLLIVDLRMPSFGGDLLYETLAVERPDLARRVLFATGDVLSQDTRRFLERAGGRLLEKPFGIDEVRSTVHSFFEECP